MKLFVVQMLVLLAMAHSHTICMGDTEEDEDPVKLSQPVMACSRFLACLLERLCSSGIKLIKRDTSAIMNKLVPDELQDSMTEKRLKLETRLRPRRQVIDECCLQACTIKVLMQYCPAGSSIFDQLPPDET